MLLFQIVSCEKVQPECKAEYYEQKSLVLLARNGVRKIVLSAKLNLIILEIESVLSTV